MRYGESGKEAAETFSRAYAEGGWKGAWIAAAELDLTHSPVADPVTVARCYLRAGEEELALNQLERGFELHDHQMITIGWSPAFDPLRDEPRFQDLLRRMNLPQYQPVPSGN